MSHTEIALDWKILEGDDDEEWFAVTSPSSFASGPTVSPHTSRSRRVTLFAAILAVICLSATSALLYRRADENLQQVERELRIAVSDETWTNRHLSQDTARHGVDPQAPMIWKSFSSNSNHNSQDDATTILSMETRLLEEKLVTSA